MGHNCHMAIKKPCCIYDVITRKLLRILGCSSRYFLKKRKFSTFWLQFQPSSISFTDSTAFRSWTKVLIFYWFLQNKLGHKGLNKYPKCISLSQNCLKSDYIHILMEKIAKVRKMEKSVCLFNPLCTSVAIWQHKHQVAFMTS